LGSLGDAPLDNEHAVIVRAGGIFEVAGTAPQRKILLDGGTLIGRGTVQGPIEVAAPSTIRANDARQMSIEGAITGASDLVLDGPYFNAEDRNDGLAIQGSLAGFEGDLSIVGGRVRIEGDNSGYEGALEVSAQALRVSGSPHALGSGEVTILPDGKLEVPERLTADLHLAGGEIYFLGDLGVLDGPVSVSEDLRLHAPERGEIAGPLHLQDGVQLKVAAEVTDSVAGRIDRVLGSIHVTGEFEAAGSVEIVSFDSTVTLEGTIVSGAADTQIDLIGPQTFMLGGSFLVRGGHSLLILENGVPVEVSVHGDGNTLSGSGVLANDLTLADGAELQPGSSTGTLFSRGDVVLGAGGIYEWEISDALGSAGGPQGWDLLSVGEMLRIGATEVAPFVIRVIGLDETGQAGSIANFDPRRSFQWVIASAEEISLFDASRFEIDTDGFFQHHPSLPASRFSLQREGANLLLAYSVPEPGTFELIGAAFACTILVVRSRMRRI
jgi:hypothetical protein